MAMKPNGKSPVFSDYDEKFMFFRDISLGPHETQLRFHLLHFWDAWNPVKKTLLASITIMTSHIISSSYVLCSFSFLLPTYVCVEAIGTFRATPRTRSESLYLRAY
ncbi:hypothetical protein Bca101_080425 [Brassica carinata]